ncbi:DUF968 domain-containing protein [Hafnia paralvei]|uniref:DUF968 domain-containing protein n=1 Tax=Hafnia paralvei TaxID=546367 RepID=UPI001FFF1C3E|nr:DUF968 domain-containing protein [Hafnia paralvei]MCK2180741.1 DUF968 domain-containing protein [Hafnia paralvei]
MRMILTAFPQTDAGVVLLKPGQLTCKFHKGQRIMITEVPKEFEKLPAGELPAQSQDLANDMALRSFFSHYDVIKAAGTESALEVWVDKIKICQWKRNHHDRNLNTVPHKNGAVRLCWSCDNLHHDQFHPSLGDIAEINRAEWLVDSVRRSLGFNEGHQLTLPELGWWAFLNGLTHLLPTSIAYRVTKTPEPPAFVGGVMKEADINPWQPDPDKVLSDLIVLAKPIIKLAGDEAPPASFMLKPKLARWECEKYMRWVKTQKCCGCNKPADDPHHVINHGLGGMGTKAHDLFVLPLCRRCHDKLHKDVAAWEQKHGDQRFLLIEFLNYALGVGAIFQA